MTPISPTILCAVACLLFVSSVARAAELMIDENDGLVNGDGWFNWDGPLNPGDTIWFDVLISDGMGESAEGVQITLAVEPAGHGGALTFDATTSEAVDGDVNYWIFGNSVGATALDLGGNSYQFGDGPDNPPSAPLEDLDIVARFAFTWDGVVGDYLVTVDTSTQNTFLLQNFNTVEPAWAFNPVTLYVPEPTTACLLVLPSLLLIRRR